MYDSKRPRVIAVAAVLGGVILGFGIGHHRMPTELLSPPKPQQATVAEDDWRWNCLTMGNRLCGPDWHPLDQRLTDLLEVAEPVNDWSQCLTVNDGEADLIACPDGRPVVAL